MISKLTGILDSVGSDHLVIDVGGIGYFVSTSAKTLSALPTVGNKISLLIETITRQESQQLCGFLQEDERQWFRLLLSVQGVGAKVALSLLSILSPQELGEAIFHQDKHALTRAEGIGLKVASRIVLELKDKKVGNELSSSPFTNPFVEDALGGLIGLGYQKAEIMDALRPALQNKGSEPLTAESLIRLGLQKLAKTKVSHG